MLGKEERPQNSRVGGRKNARKKENEEKNDERRASFSLEHKPALMLAGPDFPDGVRSRLVLRSGVLPTITTNHPSSAYAPGLAREGCSASGDRGGQHRNLTGPRCIHSPNNPRVSVMSPNRPTPPHHSNRIKFHGLLLNVCSMWLLQRDFLRRFGEKCVCSPRPSRSEGRMRRVAKVGLHSHRFGQVVRRSPSKGIGCCLGMISS